MRDSDLDEQFFPRDADAFAELAARGNLVPVWCEVLADLETPVSAFLKLRDENQRGDAWLLESVEGGAVAARYSFLGTSSRARAMCG